MKSYQKLTPFPLGEIRAEGFLREQLMRAKDGMTGHLYELEPEMIDDPFLRDSTVPGWENGNQEGWGGEISANYWAGYIQSAFVLADEEMIARATEWVDGALRNQLPDGYLGTYRHESSDIYDDYNAWSCARAARALLGFYEATGRRDVLEAVRRCMLWFCEKWSGDRKTAYAGVALVEPMIWLYRETGDERFLRFSEEYLEFLVSHDVYENAYTDMLSDEYHYNSHHTAGLGVQVALPALVFSANGREELLDASEKELSKVWRYSTHLTGGPVSMVEFLGPVGGNTESEYCNFAFFGQAYAHLAAITGRATYGEHHEEMFYNAAQGARKKDERAIAYLSAPNQHYASHLSSTSIDDYQVYAPCFLVSCCPVNAVTVLPEFVRSTFLHEGDTLYAMMYGPCSLHSDRFALREETLYPFRNSVRFVIEKSGSFTLAMRLPTWAQGYALSLNGEEVEGEERDGFIRLHRDFKANDTVELSFRTKVKVVRIDDTDYARKYPVAVRYGALVYSYHIPELWEKYVDTRVRPLPEGWSWYTVWATFTPAEGADQYEINGRKRDQISWNIALDEHLTAADFEVEEREVSGYVWEQPPVCLHTHAYKAPYLVPNYPHKTFEPYGEYLQVTHRLPLTLVPYGCTNLRVTYFPKADLSTLPSGKK